MSKTEKLDLTENEKILLKRFFKEKLAANKVLLSRLPETIGLGGTTIRKCVNQGNGTKTNLGIILKGVGVEPTHPVFRRFVYDEDISDPFGNEQIEPTQQTSALSLRKVHIVGIFLALLMLAVSATSYVNHNNNLHAMEVTNAALAEDPIRFFKEARSNARKHEVFRQALAFGLGPEKRVKNEKYGETAILYAAFQAGNFEAITELLKAGSSAHAFQQLIGTRHPAPFFLFPIHHIASSEYFSTSEKEYIINLMLDQPIAYYDPKTSGLDQNAFSRGDSTWITPREALPIVMRFTDKSPSNPILDKKIAREAAICRTTKDKSREDWCTFARSIPAAFQVTDNALTDIRVIYIQDLISISNGRAYFYAIQHYGSQSVTSLLEALPDDNNFRLHTYGALNDKIRGACDEKHNSNPMGYCWRYFDIEVFSNETAKIDGQFSASVVRFVN